MLFCLVSAPVNQPPLLVNAIDVVNTQLGVYFEFEIPAYTFYDLEDGNTKHLNLQLVQLNLQPLGTESWVQFDREKQVLYGLPIQSDITPEPIQLVLIATDSGKQIARDVLEINIDTSSMVALSHAFITTFDIDYSIFMQKLDNLVHLLQTIADYFGDPSISSMTISGVWNGSLVLVWTNSSMSKEECDNDTILHLYDMMVDNEHFQQAMLSEYPVKSVNLTWLGVCVLPPDVEPIITSVPPMTGESVIGANSWTITVLPAIIIALVILILAGVYILIRQRRRKQAGRFVLDDEKPIFKNDRKPVLLAEEMELNDVNHKPKKPVMLNNDYSGYVENLPPQQQGAHPEPPSYSHTGRLGPLLDSLEGQMLPEYYAYDGPGASHPPPPQYRFPPPYAVFPRLNRLDKSSHA